MRDRSHKTISISQMSCFGCRLRWFWSYVRGLRRDVAPVALSLGGNVHQALDQYYGSGQLADPVDTFLHLANAEIEALSPQWEDQRAALEEARDLGVAMLTGYVEEHHEEDLRRWEVLATEHSLERRLPVYGSPTQAMSLCWLAGRMDLLVRDRQLGRVFVVEHKTFSRFSPWWLDLDQQMTALTWLAEELEVLEPGETIEGVIWNGLRKQKPSSRVRNPLFERHHCYRNRQQIEAFLSRAYLTYRDMMASRAAYPEPDVRGCGGCEFMSPCIALQRGEDWQLILSTQFTSRAEREAEEVDGDDS